MPFDRTPEVIHPGRRGEYKFKALAGGQRNPVIERLGLFTCIRYDVNLGSSQQGTLKPVSFPALIPHDEVHGLPGLHVNPRRRQVKIIHDDGHFLILGRTGREAKQDDRQEFDHSPAPC